MTNRLPDSMLDPAANTLADIELAVSQASQAVELELAAIALNYGEITEEASERLRHIAGSLAEIIDLSLELQESVESVQSPTISFPDAEEGSSRSSQFCQPDRPKELTPIDPRNAHSGQPAEATPTRPIGDKGSSNRTKDGEKSSRRPRSPRTRSSSTPARQPRQPRQHLSEPGNDTVTEEANVDPVIPSKAERPIPKASELYARLVSPNDAPEAEVNQDKPVITVEIKNNNNLVVNGQVVTLTGHNLFLFNVLLLNRDAPLKSSVFHRYGYHPEGKPSTKRQSLSPNIKQFLGIINDADMTLVYANTKNPRRHLFRINPQLQFVDQRENVTSIFEAGTVEAADDNPLSVGDEQQDLPHRPEISSDDSDEESDGTVNIITRMVKMFENDPKVRRFINRYRTGTPAATSVISDPIGRYFQEIAEFRLLTAEDEIDLFTSLYKGIEAQVAIDEDLSLIDTNPELIEQIKEAVAARQVLVLSNMRLVINIAKKHSYAKRVDMLSRIQEGSTGLVRAIETFDVSKGFKFSTYATQWVDQKITRAIGNDDRTIRLPIHVVERINKVNAIKSKFEVQHGREATPEEVAELSKGKLTAKDVDYLIKLSMMDPATIDGPIVISSSTGKNSGETNLEDYLAGNGHDDLETHIKDIDDQYEIEKMIESSGLNEREMFVLSARFGIVIRSMIDKVLIINDAEVTYQDALALTLITGRGMTLEETSKFLSVTRERIRQIEAKAVQSIKW